MSIIRGASCSAASSETQASSQASKQHPLSSAASPVTGSIASGTSLAFGAGGQPGGHSPAGEEDDMSRFGRRTKNWVDDNWEAIRKRRVEETRDMAPPFNAQEGDTGFWQEEPVIRKRAPRIKHATMQKVEQQQQPAVESHPASAAVYSPGSGSPATSLSSSLPTLSPPSPARSPAVRPSAASDTVSGSVGGLSSGLIPSGSRSEVPPLGSPKASLGHSSDSLQGTVTAHVAVETHAPFITPQISTTHASVLASLHSPVQPSSLTRQPPDFQTALVQLRSSSSTSKSGVPQFNAGASEGPPSASAPNSTPSATPAAVASGRSVTPLGGPAQFGGLMDDPFGVSGPPMFEPDEWEGTFNVVPDERSYLERLLGRAFDEPSLTPLQLPQAPQGSPSTRLPAQPLPPRQSAPLVPSVTRPTVPHLASPLQQPAMSRVAAIPRASGHALPHQPAHVSQPVHRPPAGSSSAPSLPMRPGQPMHLSAAHPGGPHVPTSPPRLPPMSPASFPTDNAPFNDLLPMINEVPAYDGGYYAAKHYPYNIGEAWQQQPQSRQHSQAQPQLDESVYLPSTSGNPTGSASQPSGHPQRTPGGPPYSPDLSPSPIPPSFIHLGPSQLHPAGPIMPPAQPVPVSKVQQPPPPQQQQPIPALQTQQESDRSAPIWEYEDPSGQIQGLFSTNQMLAWFRGNYFPPKLLMRFNSQMPYVPFNELYCDQERSFSYIPSLKSYLYGNSSFVTEQQHASAMCEKEPTSPVEQQKQQPQQHPQAPNAAASPQQSSGPPARIPPHHAHGLPAQPPASVPAQHPISGSSRPGSPQLSAVAAGTAASPNLPPIQPPRQGLPYSSETGNATSVTAQMTSDLKSLLQIGGAPGGNNGHGGTVSGPSRSATGGVPVLVPSPCQASAASQASWSASDGGPPVGVEGSPRVATRAVGGPSLQVRPVQPAPQRANRAESTTGEKWATVQRKAGLDLGDIMRHESDLAAAAAVAAAAAQQDTKANFPLPDSQSTSSRAFWKSAEDQHFEGLLQTSASMEEFPDLGDSPLHSSAAKSGSKSTRVKSSTRRPTKTLQEFFAGPSQASTFSPSKATLAWATRAEKQEEPLGGVGTTEFPSLGTSTMLDSNKRRAEPNPNISEELAQLMERWGINIDPSVVDYLKTFKNATDLEEFLLDSLPDAGKDVGRFATHFLHALQQENTLGSSNMPPPLSRQGSSGKGKKKKAKAVLDPSLLGFCVKSNRILQGTIDRGDE